MINCPCGYGNNLPDGTEKCSVCGMNLLPISKLKMLYKKYYDNALFLYNNKKADEALVQVLISLNLKDDFIDSYLLLSEIYGEKKDYRKSASVLNKALSYNPESKEIPEQLKAARKKINKNEIFRCSRSIILDIVFPVVFFVMVFIMSNTDVNENQQNTIIAPAADIQTAQQLTAKQDKGMFFTYIIQENETLSKISIKFFGNTKESDEIYELNKNLLNNKNKIHSGMKIKIPVR